MSQMKTTGMSSWKKGFVIGSMGFFHPNIQTIYNLVGGFKYFLCSTLLGEEEPILTNIFQLGWNHQLDK